MTDIISIREALALVDAALRPSEDDLHKAKQLRAGDKYPEAVRAREIWAAAREGVCKQFLAGHLVEIIERRTRACTECRIDDPATVDWDRCLESIWTMNPADAEDFALDVEDGGHGELLWSHAATA